MKDHVSESCLTFILAFWNKAIILMWKMSQYIDIWLDSLHGMYCWSKKLNNKEE